MFTSLIILIYKLQKQSSTEFKKKKISAYNTLYYLTQYLVLSEYKNPYILGTNQPISSKPKVYFFPP